MKLHTAVKRMVNECFSPELQMEAQVLTQSADSDIQANYLVLELALENEMVYGTADLIKGFYEEEDLSKFNLTDVLIAKIITTLAELTGKDVKKEYYEKLTLDPYAPELVYLTKLTTEYLKNK